MRLRPLRYTLLLLVMALAIVGCTSTGDSNGGGYGTSGDTEPEGTSASATTVIESGNAFQPATLEVAVGDVITFENQDAAPHDVSIDGKDLGTQGQGESVTWTAEKAGTFPYSCTIHPSMTGEIVVK